MKRIKNIKFVCLDPSFIAASWNEGKCIPETLLPPEEQNLDSVQTNFECFDECSKLGELLMGCQFKVSGTNRLGECKAYTKR